MAATRRVLRDLPEIRHWFRTQTTPVYFVSATAFNLLGMDRWMPAFRYVNWFDSFEGHHPSVFVPQQRERVAFESIEEICNHLLGHREVVEWIRGRGGGGSAAFLMFDEETEALCADAGLGVAFPPAALRHRLDSKIETTRLADEAGVPSVPNVIGHVATWEELRALADGAGLDDELVVQTPYGDSGQTTYFLSGPDDWARDGDELAGEHLKVMRRIDPREAAIEGVVTRHGTLVGPLMTELTGFPELTPYGGGWCGNEVDPHALTDEHRAQARVWTEAFGERLRGEGYRGYFELDFLVDARSGGLYLGELNPRVTGASSITNVNAVAYGDMPLFLFHLLEFMDVDYEIDVAGLNERWSRPAALDTWSQFVLKETEDVTELLEGAPETGVWRLEGDGRLAFVRRDTDWHDIRDESEAFFLRIAAPGGYRYPGADLGILVARGRLQDDHHELTPRALDWIRAVKGGFHGSPLPSSLPEPVPEPFGFKLL